MLAEGVDRKIADDCRCRPVAVVSGEILTPFQQMAGESGRLVLVELVQQRATQPASRLGVREQLVNERCPPRHRRDLLGKLAPVERRAAPEPVQQIIDGAILSQHFAVQSSGDGSGECNGTGRSALPSGNCNAAGECYAAKGLAASRAE